MSRTFTHSMDQEVAVATKSADAALIFHRVSYWIEGQAENADRHNGYVRVRTQALVDRFPWLSPKQVRSALKKLCEAGYLARAEDEAGNPLRLGANKTDASPWFTLGDNFQDQPEKVQKPHENKDAQMGSPDAQMGSPDAQMGSPDAQMGSPDAQMGTSIKNNLPSNLPSNTSPSCARGRLKPDLPREEEKDAIQEAWNVTALAAGYSPLSIVTPQRLRLMRDRLAECGGDLTMVLEAIRKAAFCTHWRGPGDGSHVTFDWMFGPPKSHKPDRFIEAFEHNEAAPKACHERPNRTDANRYLKSDELDEGTRLALAQLEPLPAGTLSQQRTG